MLYYIVISFESFLLFLIADGIDIVEYNFAVVETRSVFTCHRNRRWVSVVGIGRKHRYLWTSKSPPRNGIARFKVEDGRGYEDDRAEERKKRSAVSPPCFLPVWFLQSFFVCSKAFALRFDSL